MIISFAWTLEAFLSGQKTMTRRNWTEEYASRFHPGDVHDAYDKNPRVGGKKIGQIRITKAPYYQPLSAMPDEDFEREGGTLHWKDKEEFIAAMGGTDKWYWVIEFEKIHEK